MLPATCPGPRACAGQSFREEQCEHIRSGTKSKGRDCSRPCAAPPKRCGLMYQTGTRRSALQMTRTIRTSSENPNPIAEPIRKEHPLRHHTPSARGVKLQLWQDSELGKNLWGEVDSYSHPPPPGSTPGGGLARRSTQASNATRSTRPTLGHAKASRTGRVATLGHDHARPRKARHAPWHRLTRA